MVLFRPTDIKHLLRGAAIPGLIVAVCITVGVITSLSYNGLNQVAALRYAKAGLVFGLFVSLFGIIELIVSLIALGGFQRKTFFRSLVC